MKKIIIFIVLLYMGIILNAQSFNVYTDENCTSIINNGDTITINADSSGQISYEFFGYIKNNTPTDLSIHIEMAKILVSEGNLLQLCFNGVCHNSLVCDGTVGVASPEELHITLYYTASDTASNIIQVTVMPTSSKGDTSIFYVKFKPAAATSNNILSSPKIFVSKPYPNPADEYVHFKYNIVPQNETYIIIYNILGNEILRKKLSQNEGIVTINTTNFRNGYYIYTLKYGSKKITTNRFLVKH